MRSFVERHPLFVFLVRDNTTGVSAGVSNVSHAAEGVISAYGDHVSH